MPKSRKTSDTASKVYQLKVDLIDAHIPIWRRLQVEPATTLYEFHDILQIVMGWEDYHLHAFCLASPGKKGPKRRYGHLETEVESTTRLADAVRRRGDWFLYEYDFGDSWEHQIVLEEVIPFSPTANYPLVLDGEGACPPEDVGGVYGYYNYLEAINNPDHPDHEEMVEWREPCVDPSAFDVKAVNRRFHGKKTP